jgi:structural toxin protein (hemagglutinin/hemolysin) RtxA
MYQITFYVPESHLESVKQAMFNKGAGKVGYYDCCAWQILGQGQFRPGKGSKPFIGEQNKLDVVMEYKVEMVCAADCIREVIMALKQSHPYEEPAYAVIKLEDV